MKDSLNCEAINLSPVGSPTEVITPRYALGTQPGEYLGKWNGQVVSHPRPEDDGDEWVRAQTGYCKPFFGPAINNYLVRRDPVALVSGDLPRFALLDYRRIPHASPTPFLLGDARIRVKIAENEFWLDEHGTVETRYLPWGTEHHVAIGNLIFTVTAALVDTCGMAISLKVEKDDNTPVEIFICYGGLGNASMRGGDRPECLLLNPEQELNDQIIIENGVAILADDDIPYAVRVQANTGEVMRMANTDGIRQWAAFRRILNEKVTHLHLVVGKQVTGAATLNPAHTKQYIAETQSYYRDLLAGTEISTPDKLLDAAFYTSIVGMDYIYSAPGWLEGLTGWATYFSNNYQFSAAVALRQYQYAKTAVRFCALHPDGPGQVYLADCTTGSPEEDDHQADGLLYMILQFYHYWKATGDNATLAEVWPPICHALEQFIALRDSDGDGLLDFHKGCNVFLYQADHLSLPGAAFTPSVMLAGILQRMAEMADSIAENTRADKWRQQVETIYQQLLDNFWDTDEGRFVANIDPQGQRQIASYYTDYAFPSLYTDLPSEKRYQSLLAMDKALSLGPCLLRTGNYLPELFGNNGIHQVGMAEAAEAQCREGRAQRGWELLHGVAVGATVISYCPGTMYEFASWEGKGLLNKHFGNQIGCYIRAVVTGLFGFTRTAATMVQTWQPAIPEVWPHARLRLGGIGMEVTGTVTSRTYRLQLETPQPASFRLPLYGHSPEKVVDANGNDVAFTIESHPAGGFIHIALPAEIEHSVTVVLSPAITQHVSSLMIPDAEKAKLAIKRLSGRRESLDLTSYFNSDRIRPDSFWYNTIWVPGNELTYDLRPYVVQHSTETGMLTVGDYNFTVNSTGQNLVVLAQGDFHPKTNRLELATVPSLLTLNIGKFITGLELLTVAEPRIRLTGMKVGEVVCCYADGVTETVPLIVGEQLDATLSPYATQTIVLKLAQGHNGLSKHLSAWQVAVDSTKITETVTISITSYDMVLGIFAVNMRVVETL